MAGRITDNPVGASWASRSRLVAANVLYSFVGAILVGLCLSYATRPVYRWLDVRGDHPDLNATVTLLVVGHPLLLVLLYAGFVGLREADQLLRQANLEHYRSVVRPYLAVTPSPGSPGSFGGLRDVLDRLLAVASTVFLWGIRLFVIVAVAFYLLRDDYKMADWFRRAFEGELRHRGVPRAGRRGFGHHLRR